MMGGRGQGAQPLDWSFLSPRKGEPHERERTTDQRRSLRAQAAVVRDRHARGQLRLVLGEIVVGPWSFPVHGVLLSEGKETTSRAVARPVPSLPSFTSSVSRGGPA